MSRFDFVRADVTIETAKAGITHFYSALVHVSPTGVVIVKRDGVTEVFGPSGFAHVRVCQTEPAEDQP